MPALIAAAALNSLADRATISDVSSTLLPPNATQDLWEVVCAWPVSGQYGPGSRVLYYVVVAACVFARKIEWLRAPCLAAALLFPAVAAIHGVVLAAVHRDGAVDMDVFGAFQLCAISILAAPVTVKHSRTYFFDPGRNTIFVWTILLLAGLLSLTVEFYRINPVDCPFDDAGNPISRRNSNFPYEEITCGLKCTIDDGPQSPLRDGSTREIFVIPAPDRLTFGTATLLAAACCIPAILSLATMWIKILQLNWKTSFGSDHVRDEGTEIEGTNGTVGRMKGVNDMVRFFLRFVEVPVFGAAVVFILIIGEWNLFSYQVRYQTEPMSSVGQWAPIVGTCLAILGSGYLLLAADIEAIKEGGANRSPSPSPHHCHCSRHHLSDDGALQPGLDAGFSLHREHVRHSDDNDDSLPPDTIAPMREVSTSHRLSSDHRSRSSSEVQRPYEPRQQSSSDDPGGRRKVVRVLTAVGARLGTPARDWFDDAEFKRGRAVDFPEIPGEGNRNPELSQIRQQYNPRRDSQGNATPVPRSHSRAPSLRSIASALDLDEEQHPRSPQSPQSPHGWGEAGPVYAPHGRPHSNTLPPGTGGRTTFENGGDDSSAASSSAAGGPAHRLRRGATLEVPSPVYHGPPRRGTSPVESPITRFTIAGRGETSPAIVVSSDLGPSIAEGGPENRNIPGR